MKKSLTIILISLTISVTYGQAESSDLVKRGQLLGLCGNSGNSSQPHLHFHLQDLEDFNKSTGIKCYFDKLQVNGSLKINYSPVKGDKVKTVN